MNCARPHLFAVLVLLLASNLARADLVVPASAACAGKKAGEPCDGGVCESVGHECKAGTCRRFDNEGDCAKNGCSWVEELRCTPAATTPPEATPPSTTPSAPSTTSPATEAPRAAPPASCALAPATLSPVALVGLLLLRGRRRLLR